MTSRNHDTEVLPLPVDSTAELNEALAAAAPRRWWNRTTLALLGVAMLIGGFLGGVQAHERWGIESTQATGGGPAGGEAVEPSGGAVAASPEPGGGPGGGAQGAMAEGATGTSGTVKRVDGTTLYVQTADGETVTVRTGGDTIVKVSQAATLESVTSGLAVTVEGVADAEGIITATAVTAG
ncbi:hypothetical protein QLQ12_00585 [Actinoplanes sp. NEAU-A12]|uniref:DUF5666 domain-containing protein n=1 Tax=Actinoplanes sandaracinus TaxID=3045177 RepID=A0ABT6WBM8_9ACTN|nr:hypothetical protein [Actinoplanes sandaracinus]MDI6097104.1 hypothetical protein [Actinoplanes sandaracinus]